MPELIDPVTTSEFATAWADLTSDLATGSITQAQFITSITPFILGWSGNATEPAALGTNLSNTIGNWMQFVTAMTDFFTITPTGGPNSNGTFVVVDYYGVSHTLDSYQKIASTMAKGDPGKSMLSGVGAPASGLGYDGDVYLDTTGGNLYAKASGVWAIATNLRGPTGKSAYDIAVEEGYSGDEASWIVSLNGDDGEEVSLQKTDTHIQWRLGTGAWVNLIALTEITGPQGESVELQKTATHIQWRVIGDPTWINLVALSEIKGDKGDKPAFSIGTVTTLDPDEDATAEDVGTDGDIVLNLGLPRGSQGLKGDKPSFTVGTVTTLETGEPAVVEDVGVDGDIILNLSLPKGNTGEKGSKPWILTGDWEPETPYSEGNATTPADAIYADGNSYVCVETHTSGLSFAADLASGYWQIIAHKGADGLGSGDVVGPAGDVVNNQLVAFDGTSGKVVKGGPLVGVLGAGDLPTRADGDGRWLLQTNFTWSGLAGKPDTFVPSAHTHSASDIVSGVLDPARIPVLYSGVQVISSGDLTALTTEQQDTVTQGATVTTTDGSRWTYKGTGSKTDSASYILIADITPEWSVVSNKPANIVSLAGLSLDTDIGIYSTGANTFATYSLTAFGRTLSGLSGYSALKSGLALGIPDVAGLQTALDNAGAVKSVNGQEPDEDGNVEIIAGTSPIQIKTGNYTATAGDRILAITSDGSFVITLPTTPELGDEIQISGDFFINSLTVTASGQSIEDSTYDLELDMEQTNIRLLFDGSTWKVIL